MDNHNIYEKKHQDYITNLKNKYSNYKSEYSIFYKLNAYCIYDLYVELPQTHPYFSHRTIQIQGLLVLSITVGLAQVQENTESLRLPGLTECM